MKNAGHQILPIFIAAAFGTTQETSGGRGKLTMIGERIEYIFTNARHTNPLCRVTPKGLVNQEQDFDYDREKYRELLLEAAETVLRFFGFDMS